MEPQSEKNTDVNHNIALPYEWALKKVLGPTLDEFGGDLAALYKKGRDMIVGNAETKVPEGTEHYIANLRVAWNVLFSGSFSDSAIEAEYLGGILAGSRSVDGKDDKGIYYFDIVKSLSSSQLYLHYCLYRSLNNALASKPEYSNMNLGVQNDLAGKQLYFIANELVDLGLSFDIDFTALHSKGLIQSFEVQPREMPDPRNPSENIKVGYVAFVPSSLGFQLYAVGNNKLSEWRTLNSVVLNDFQNTIHPKWYDFDLVRLVKRTMGISE